ncbi:hypothetical protein [Tsukamurella tyrosinosolvens]|uniref:hypothetical protein n=1 Tax=Tsukamurella tyrosinosolvens TaxID=57704 RepID=UPI000DF70893|nr:hypothetical protein [Tsukamurella tyrosinosolvens]RDB46820.1 hypothetical protein DVB87_16365 [Tsukamurella tyrosinosolvens]
MRTGRFTASTGPLTVTEQTIADAITAHQARVHRAPVLKIGHDDPRFNFDGAPSVGWLENLRADPTGTVLLADLHGVPRWLADAIPTSFPSRSIEAEQGYLDADGRAWPFVVTGLALLGATAPAINSLADLRQFVAARAARPATPVTVIAAARRARRNR